MANPGPPLLETPTAIPGYLLEELLDRRVGSWSDFRASDLARDRRVAVTLLSVQLTHDRDYARRFEREMSRVARLDHPNLVRVLDSGRAPRGLYLVTELEDAQPLDEDPSWGALDPEGAIRLLAPVADALDHAHKRGLVHRWVAPASILVTGGGQAMLTHFGLAHPVAAARGSDPSALAFMAPEFVERGQATARSDVYGLAATMFGVLTGAAPPALHPPARRVAGTPPADPAEPLRGDLEAVIQRSLAFDPGRRAGSAGELISEMKRVTNLTGDATVTLRSGPVRGPTSPEPAPRPVLEPTGHREALRPRPRAAADPPPRDRRGRPRRPRRTLIGVAVALLAAAGGLYAALESDSPEAAPQGAVASTRELRLTVPASWSLADDVTGVAGLPLDESMQLIPSRTGPRGQSARLAAGLVRQVDDRLLPVGFASRVTTEPVEERVRIGRYAGYRFTGLVLRETNQRLNLYAVPTTEGAATIACLARPGERVFLSRCEAVATTLELLTLKTRPLEPSDEYVAALNAALQRLSARLKAGRAALRTAREPSDQARLADRLASDYRTAAGELSRAPRNLSDPAGDAALVSEMEDVGDAYAAVARGARRGSRSQFAAATKAVARRERRLRTSVEALRRADGRSGGS
jgi:hypothetical protein